jgi:hypothetical protein
LHFDVFTRGFLVLRRLGGLLSSWTFLLFTLIVVVDWLLLRRFLLLFLGLLGALGLGRLDVGDEVV